MILDPISNDTKDLPNVTAPENALGTAIDQATRAVDDYIRHPKGYVTRVTTSVSHDPGVDPGVNFWMTPGSRPRGDPGQKNLNYP